MARNSLAQQMMAEYELAQSARENNLMAVLQILDVSEGILGLGLLGQAIRTTGD
jgi:hypothetical protein